MTVWIGLTGAIGSGKSQVAACFAKLGAPIIDADKIAKQLMNLPDVIQKIQAVFGDEILDGSGSLNRAGLREKVFANEFARKKLEQILHPLILDEIQNQQRQFFQAAYGIIELPTLAENPIFQNIIQKILVVICDEKIRIERVMRRSGLTEQAVRAIIRAQASDATRMALANDLICNEGSLDDLCDAVFALHQRFSGCLKGSD